MRIKRLLFVGASTAVLAASLFASAAVAAAPANDTFSGATAISSIPFSTIEDTTQSTLDPADTAAGNACGAGGLQFANSVWFSYKPTSNQFIRLDPSATDYTVGVAVLTGSPAGFSSVSCSLGGAVFSVNAGTTYYIDIAQFGFGSGGTLNFSLSSLPDPISQFAIDSSGSFDKSSGSATVTGTITCAAGAFSFGFGQVTTDAHGRNAAIGSGGFFGAPLSGLTCDGASHQWSLTVAPPSGQFKGGPVSATIDVGACSIFCASRRTTQTVTLKQ